MKIDQEKFDEIVLALLFHNSWREKVGEFKVYRAWKSLDWDALDRLHEKELIGSPQGKAKSVVVTDEGYALAKRLFEELFAADETSKAQGVPERNRQSGRSEI